jgi:hypothetical protein
MSFAFKRPPLGATARRFLRDNAGGMVARWAAIVGVIVVGSVVSARLLDVAAHTGALPSMAFFRSGGDFARVASTLPRAGTPGPAGQAPQIDPTATASIATRAGAVLIDPCTGNPR